MIYFCADDYGLNDVSSKRIQQCIENGVLNKVSVFSNFDKINFENLLNEKKVKISLHLNLVEGKCTANADEIDLLADESGNFKHTFGGLFKQWLFNKKNFEVQLYKEIKAQVLEFKNILPPNVDFCVDSHQHTHMIPSVFKTLIKVLNDEKIDVKYMRIPIEPIWLYIKTPSLYFSYSVVNIIKQWLLNFLWIINRRKFKKTKIPTAYFLGIMFSGNMNQKFVTKILPKYIKLAKKHNRDIEVLFHPGYLKKDEIDFENKNIVFEKFYISENRKTEFDTLLKLLEGSGL